MADAKIEKNTPPQTTLITRIHHTGDGSDVKSEIKIIQREVSTKKDSTHHFIHGNKIEPIELRQYGSDNKLYVYLSEQPRPGDVEVTANKHDIQQLINGKRLDQDTGKRLIKVLEAHETCHNILQTATSKQNINQRVEAFLNEASDEMIKNTEAIRRLVAIKESLKKELEVDKIGQLFKKNVDPENCFGVNKTLMDRLNYLPELLQNAELIYPQDGSSTYKITSTLSNESESGVGPIGLESTLQFSKNSKTPEDAFRKFLTDMNDALKVFLEYWALANNQDAFCYEADITDIMAVSTPERKSYFAVKEKVRFWELSQLLERTYLTLSFKHNGKWINLKHPFLTLSVTASNKKNQEKLDGYPNKVVARVLNPDDFQKKACMATEISNGTLKLPAKDIMLALTVQTRASQRRNEITSNYDEKYLITKAGLQKTQISNPRMAHKRLAEKLNRIEAADGIDGWQKTNSGKYAITQRNTKK